MLRSVVSLKPACTLAIRNKIGSIPNLLLLVQKQLRDILQLRCLMLSLHSLMEMIKTRHMIMRWLLISKFLAFFIIIFILLFDTAIGSGAWKGHRKESLFL